MRDTLSLDTFVQSIQPASTCRIAILGLGTVGSAVARRLTAADRPRGLVLTHVCDRRAADKRGAWMNAMKLTWTDDIDEVLQSDVDVVVEAIGGREPAASWSRRALLAGKSVVTANKQVIAREGASLQLLAARQGRQVRFEAAVGGATPVVRAISGGLSGDRLTRIAAILNGTTNAVLSQMEAAGCSLEEALADARSRGYAEADASLDLDGGDAAAKLAILCALAFALRVDPDGVATSSTVTITRDDFAAARMAGGTIRQVAYAEHDAAQSTLTAWVAPIVVPRASPFGRTRGPENVAVITGTYSGETVISGAGAGGDATAVAILSDVLAIARDRAAVVPAPSLSAPGRILGLGASASRTSCFSLPTSHFPLPTSNFPLSTSQLLEAV